jgi:hypothetical protein
MFNAFVGLPTTLLTVWMLYDAISRRAEPYWFFVILTPMGAWIYFFVVKIHDYDWSNWRRALAWQSKPAIDELRRTVEETPSDANKLALGEALLDKGDHQAAAVLFDEILRHDREDKEALYGLARCHLKAEAVDLAITRLKQLQALDPAYRDYEPWFDLAFAHWRKNDQAEAVATLEALVSLAPRLKHRAIYGRYLARSHQTERARTVLQQTIDDFKKSKGHIKRTSGRWAREARETLRELKA